MIDLRIRTAIPNEELEAKMGYCLSPKDFNVLLTGPTTVRKPDGSLLCVYLPRSLPGEVVRPAWPVLHGLAGQRTDNRGLASGSGREIHGSQSRTRSKLVASSIIGAIDPGGQYRHCRLTAWTGEHLSAMDELMPLCRRVSQLFGAHVGDRYATQMRFAERTKPEWRIEDTPFTTMTVNNSYPTGVHTDQGDLEQGFSALAVLRQGDYTGCELVFPRYRVAIDMGSRDLVLMDAHEWHGNTVFRSREPTAERTQRRVLLPDQDGRVRHAGRGDGQGPPGRRPAQRPAHSVAPPAVPAPTATPTTAPAGAGGRLVAVWQGWAVPLARPPGTLRLMPRKGRPPKPTPLHVLHGTYRHDRNDHLEPVADIGPVQAPDHLSPAARALWDELAPELTRKQLLAPRYALLFEILCACLDQSRRALYVLDQTGPLVRGRNEALVANPAAGVFTRFSKLAVTLGSEFGLTPAATSAMAKAGYEDVVRGSSSDPASYLT